MATDPNRLRDTFATLDFSAHGHAWSALYKEAFYPWDRNGPSLALADLLAQRPDLVPPPPSPQDRRPGEAPPTALVPGCGRGHDVLLLSSLGYDVVGLDFSPDAIRMATQLEQAAAREHKHDEGLPVDRGQVPRGEISWVVGDFFSDERTSGFGSTPHRSGTFDLVYDYTFLCALPPDARPKWARRMSQLVRPGGHLICLEFPSGKPLSERGPPWGLTPEVYEALLSAPGEPVAYGPDGSVVDPVPAKTMPYPGALHRLSLIKPVRTHKAGTDEDGTVRDFISVWTR